MPTDVYGTENTTAQTLRVNVENFVLQNYDTFDTTLFGTNPNRTEVMMKTYNYHVSIGDIVALNGRPAKGTLLCTHTMFVLSPRRLPAVGSPSPTRRGP